MNSLKPILAMLVITNSWFTRAEDSTDQVATAVNVVSQLCLSGSEYGIDADAEGNITIKSFKPKAGASVTLNVREGKGATALQDDLRIIGDENVRSCTQKHIGRILDAVLSSSPSAVSPKHENTTIGTAKYLGYVPVQVSTQSTLDGNKQQYYRFSVLEPSLVTIGFFKNAQNVNMDLTTANENEITSGSFRNNSKTKPIFLMPDDYYIILKSRYEDRATSFEMSVEGHPDS